MEEERLDDLRIVGYKETSKPPGHEGELPDAASPEAMDLDVGFFEGWQTGDFCPRGSGPQAIADGSEPAAVDPQGQLRQAAFGAAEVEFGDAEGDGDGCHANQSSPHTLCADRPMGEHVASPPLSAHGVCGLHSGSPCKTLGRGFILVCGPRVKLSLPQVGLPKGRN
jgi:hypothetical protein